MIPHEPSSPRPLQKLRSGDSASLLRTAVIGFGISGRVFHAPLIQADNSYLLEAIVTSQPGRAAAARKTYPDARIIATPDELFSLIDAGNLALDLIVLGTPPVNHKKLAKAALERGLHVVVDKPFVPNSSDGVELIAAAAAAGRCLTVFQNRRWDGDYLTVQQLIRDGRLGDIRTFESRFEWWMPQGFGNWRDEALVAEGGGILHDLGAHLIDQAIQLFGPVAEVYGETFRHSGHDRSDADQEAFLSLRHQSGTQSRLWMNGQAPQPGPRFHVTGSRAAYTKWSRDGQEKALSEGMLPTDSRYGIEARETWGRTGVAGSLKAEPTKRGDYPQYYKQLAEALQTGGPVPVDPQDAVAVLKVIENARATPAVREAPINHNYSRINTGSGSQTAHG
ncbi:putative dehydrogenase [Arthrobacter sp. SLBN-100]|uniref:Gfo/Idh/MocA family protein n=1 Tax=Arthrobacter sp. SLBN-100 TaxID=2768450 RepID=UPI0011512600|nr:Gfo/Idh/MocA family oxidoreductase [Arthrobacter sp. SLBN-100]TQJ68830.1 putative dehydrogenase [Arthrobacter sp. SLBN-100]